MDLCMHNFLLCNCAVKDVGKMLVSKTDIIMVNHLSTTVTPWCSGYHYCVTSFNKAWTHALRGFKYCSRRVGDSKWWGTLAMILAGNKAKCLSSVNHTTKTIHQFIVMQGSMLQRNCHWSYLTPPIFIHKDTVNLGGKNCDA